MGDKTKVLVGVAEITLGVGASAQVIGYTLDGVNMTVKSEMAVVKAEEVNGPLIRTETGQEVEVTLNVMEGTLANLALAIPGSSLLTNVLTIGGGVLQLGRLTLVGLNPAGKARVIVLTEVNPVGEVGIPFKKGEASVVPITLSALIADTGVFGSLTDAAAVPPTLTVGATTKSNAAGTIIEAKFSASMASPVGKHLEFWFTEADFATTPRYFSAAALHGGDDTIIDLTVSGVAITAGKLLALSYARGTIESAAIGVLSSFAAQTVVPR